MSSFDALAAPSAPLPPDVRAAFDEHLARGTAGTSFERALSAGAASRSIGVAFALGYEAALHRLVPSIAPAELASLCVTEAAGGHPRDVRCAFDGARVTGEKRWATLAPIADALLVLAVRGERDGRKDFALVRVPRDAPGVSITPLPATPFAPEVPHAVVALAGAPGVALPGDGFDDYARPFRTVEDAHVVGAVGAHLVVRARALGATPALWSPVLAALAALSAAAALDPRDPLGHLLIEGALPQIEGAMKALAAGPAPELSPELPLLTIAARAREQRTLGAAARWGRA